MTEEPKHVHEWVTTSVVNSYWELGARFNSPTTVITMECTGCDVTLIRVPRS